MDPTGKIICFFSTTKTSASQQAVYSLEFISLSEQGSDTGPLQVWCIKRIIRSVFCTSGSPDKTQVSSSQKLSLVHPKWSSIILVAFGCKVRCDGLSAISGRNVCFIRQSERHGRLNYGGCGYGSAAVVILELWKKLVNTEFCIFATTLFLLNFSLDAHLTAYF